MGSHGDPGSQFYNEKAIPVRGNIEVLGKIEVLFFQNSSANYSARHLNPTKSNSNGNLTDLVFRFFLTDFH